MKKEFCNLFDLYFIDIKIANIKYYFQNNVYRRIVIQRIIWVIWSLSHFINKKMFLLDSRAEVVNKTRDLYFSKTKYNLIPTTTITIYTYNRKYKHYESVIFKVL